jgi:hypothetical protein
VACVVVAFRAVKFWRVVDPVTSKFEVVAAANVVFPVTASVPATATLPAESMVVVAVDPNDALVRTDTKVVDALVKVWRPVQMFGFERLRPRDEPEIWSEDPIVVVATLPEPLPVRSVPATSVSHPVPPFATWRMPVMSVVRSTKDAETRPAVALRIPVRPPKVKFDVKRFVDDAVVANVLVEVALDVVEFPAVKFWSVVDPVTDKVPVAVRCDAVTRPFMNASPETPKAAAGVVEPTPTRPFTLSIYSIDEPVTACPAAL